MDENTTLENVSKKSKFLWLYVIIIIIILVLISLFVFIKSDFKEDLNFKNNLDSNSSNNSIPSNNLEENLPETVEIITVDDPENCGTNINCFKEYSSQCMEGARFLFTDTIDSEYKTFTRTTEYTIQGIEYIYCKVNLSLYDINIELKGEFDNYNENVVSKEDIKTSGTCYFNTPQSLLDYLDLKEKGIFNGAVNCFYLEDNSIVCSSTGDMINNSCQGEYFMLQYE